MAAQETANTADKMVLTLQSPFIYQNRMTGQPSSTPLTTRQLCRIVCPVNASESTSFINPQTLLLGYDPSTHTYDPSGWKSVSAIPILKEACSSWYYESKEGVKGPVLTRALADMLNIKSDNNKKDGTAATQIDGNTRVFPSSNSNGGTVDDSCSSNGGSGAAWSRIQDLTYLQLAIEAISEIKSMPNKWPSNGDDDSDKNMDQVANMTYKDDDDNAQDDIDINGGVTQQKVHDELEAFLTSTDHLAPHAAVSGAGGESDEEEEYQSDGGTRYVKSHTGTWIHEALAPKKEEMKKNNAKKGDLGPNAKVAGATSVLTTKKRKRNKPKFSAKNARNWIYVSGLPPDTNEEEVAAYFQKVGIIDLDPETQKPKVKLYRDKKSGVLKGDASICYARPESVELALQILDENLFRDDAKLSVQRAKFEQHGTFDAENNNGGRRVISEAKRKVARLAALQAVGWDEGDNGRIAGGLKGLRIIVLMNMFNPKEIQNDTNDEKLQALEREVHDECEEFGAVEKITVFSKHIAGVMIVKFTLPNAASDAMNKLNGKVRSNGRKVEASYWDGVTDYTCRDEKKEEKETEKRLDEFGDWLEDQELPEEFKLRTE